MAELLIHLMSHGGWDVKTLSKYADTKKLLSLLDDALKLYGCLVNGDFRSILKDFTSIWQRHRHLLEPLFGTGLEVTKRLLTDKELRENIAKKLNLLIELIRKLITFYRAKALTACATALNYLRGLIKGALQRADKDEDANIRQELKSISRKLSELKAIVAEVTELIETCSKSENEIDELLEEINANLELAEGYGCVFEEIAALKEVIIKLEAEHQKDSGKAKLGIAGALCTMGAAVARYSAPSYFATGGAAGIATGGVATIATVALSGVAITVGYFWFDETTQKMKEMQKCLKLLAQYQEEFTACQTQIEELEKRRDEIIVNRLANLSIDGEY